jgi:hypothetical protein
MAMTIAAFVRKANASSQKTSENEISRANRFDNQADLI